MEAKLKNINIFALYYFPNCNITLNRPSVLVSNFIKNLTACNLIFLILNY
jgi:hypothetical protein